MLSSGIEFGFCCRYCDGSVWWVEVWDARQRVWEAVDFRRGKLLSPAEWKIRGGNMNFITALERNHIEDVTPNYILKVPRQRIDRICPDRSMLVY